MNFRFMVEQYGFKGAIDLENHIFKRNISWLLDIYDSGKALADAKAEAITKEENKLSQQFERGKMFKDKVEKNFENFVYYKFHFNYLTLHSLLISAYSILENHLLNIAKQLEFYSPYSIKIKDIHKDKSDLDKIRKYLNIIHNIETAKSDSANWQLILKFQKTRNLIVHNGNKLKTEVPKDSLTPFLQSYGVSFDEDGGFQVSNRDFLVDFQNVTAAYSDRIVTDICKKKSFNW
jgi:hypothetical protein